MGIDDKCGIDACKLLGLPFTTAIGLLVRSRQKGLIGLDDARARLSALATLRPLSKIDSRRRVTAIGGNTMTRTMSIRMDQENYKFLTGLTREESSDLSKAVRDLVTRGRVLLAVEKYKKGEASLGRAAEVAGLPVGQMMTILKEFGVRSRIEQEDYRQSLRPPRQSLVSPKEKPSCPLRIRPILEILFGDHRARWN